MPVDLRHGRRIPSGRRFARALSSVFRQAWAELRPLIEAGYAPTATDLRDVIYRLALPALAVELVAGYVGTMRRAYAKTGIRRRGIDRIRAKAVGSPTPSRPPMPTGVSGLSFDWSLFRPEVRVAAENLALRLAGEVAHATRDIIRQQLAEGLQAGRPANEIADRIEEMGFGPRRAGTIAQTESSRAMHAGQGVAARELGVTDWTWLASSDACDVCLSIDGKTVKIGEPFYVWPTGNPAYRIVTHPPAHPRCCLAETPVRAVSCIAAWHAEYQGSVVTLRFGDGSRVRVTPNHMLLSPDGFVRAADFVKGDYVIRTGTGEAKGLPDFDDPNDDGEPPTIEEVFRSLSESAGVTTRRMPTSAEDFHGDATFRDGKVDVVRPDRLLRNDGQAGLAEPFRHLSFIAGRGNRRCGLLGGGDLATVFKALLDATNGVVGRRREQLALLRGQSRIADRLGGRSVTDRKVEGFQASDDAGAGDAKRIRQAQDAIPGIISTLEVVEVDIATFGHAVPVFDLTTEETMYSIGNGIISSNCMCSTTEVIPDD